jgi:hypothetical protein
MMRRAVEWTRSRAVTLFRAGVVGVWLMAMIYLCAFQTAPTGTLDPWYSDPHGHIAETRIFPRIGRALWTTPVVTLFPTLTPAEIAALPADLRACVADGLVFAVPGFPADRPLAITWSQNPRTYPPGVFVIAAPSAVLYHWGLISFSASNRLFIAILLAAWLATVWTVTASWREHPPSPVRIALSAVGAGFLLYWGLEGMYDVTAIALGAVAFECARREKFGMSCLAFGAATIVHARLLALSPIFAFAFLGALRSWRSSTTIERLALGTGTALFGATLAFAAWIQPALKQLTNVDSYTNIYRPTVGPPLVVLGFACTIAALAAYAWRKNERWDAAMLLFCMCAFASTRYLAAWHWLLVLPWALGPAFAQVRSARAVGLVRLAAAVLCFAGSAWSR